MLYQYRVLPLVALKTRKILLLQLILVEILVIFVEIIGTLEKTVQLAKAFVTNVKRKVILQKFVSQKGVQSQLLCIKQTIMLVNHHFLLLLQLEYLVVYHTQQFIINKTKFSALIDTGSSENFISSKIIAKLKISYQEKTGTVSLATPNLKSEIKGYCILGMTLQTQTYNDNKFTILDDLCADIALGQTFMEKHSAIMLSFGEDLLPLNICSLALSNVTPPT